MTSKPSFGQPGITGTPVPSEYRPSIYFSALMPFHYQREYVINAVYSDEPIKSLADTRLTLHTLTPSPCPTQVTLRPVSATRNPNPDGVRPDLWLL